MLAEINKITRPRAAQAQSGDEQDDDELEQASPVLQYTHMPGSPVRSERPHGEQAVVGGVHVGAGAGGEEGAGGGGACSGEPNREKGQEAPIQKEVQAMHGIRGRRCRCN